MVERIGPTQKRSTSKKGEEETTQPPLFPTPPDTIRKFANTTVVLPKIVKTQTEQEQTEPIMSHPTIPLTPEQIEDHKAWSEDHERDIQDSHGG